MARGRRAFPERARPDGGGDLGKGAARGVAPKPSQNRGRVMAALAAVSSKATVLRPKHDISAPGKISGEARGGVGP